MMDEKLKLKYAGIVFAVLSILITKFIPIPGMSETARITLGVLLATLFIQIFESFNLCVSCLLSSALLMIMGCVPTISDAFSGYTNHVIYFTIASFGISAAFQKSTLSIRFLEKMLVGEKFNIRKITIMFMLCSATLSAVMSNVAAVLIFFPYLEKVLSFYHDPSHREKSAKCMNICLVVSAMMGGIITPAGSSVNLIGIDLLEKYAGIRIRFVDWMCFGLPIAFIMIFVAFAIITFVFKPVNLEEDEFKSFLSYIHDPPKIEKKDIYIGVVIFATLTAWILSSWIPALNITVVAVVSFVLLFVPGGSVLTWEEFTEANSWNAFFVAGNHITLATVAIANGLSAMLADTLMGCINTKMTLIVLITIAAITFIIMALIPSAPAVATILVPIMIPVAASTGIDVRLLFLTCILCIPNIYLLPLDAPLIVAYDRKAFKMFDLPQATFWIQLVLMVFIPLWVMFAYRFIY